MSIKFTNEITDFTAGLLFVSDDPLPPIQLANQKPSVFTSVILNTCEPNRSTCLAKFGHSNCQPRRQGLSWVIDLS